MMLLELELLGKESDERDDDMTLERLDDETVLDEEATDDELAAELETADETDELLAAGAMRTDSDGCEPSRMFVPLAAEPLIASVLAPEPVS